MITKKYMQEEEMNILKENEWNVQATKDEDPKKLKEKTMLEFGKDPVPSYEAGDISFNDRDLVDVLFPHNDPVVFTIGLANFVVQKVLVDNGNSADIIFRNVIERIGLPLTDIKIINIPLLRFGGGTITAPKGAIDLPTSFGAVVLTYHLKVKFPTRNGSGQVKGNQKQPGGKWRMCTHFTNLNKACPRDPYPLPCIDQLVDSTARCALLSIDGCLSRIPSNLYGRRRSRQNFVIIEKSFYYYRVMPFGLKNGGAIYQRKLRPYFQSHAIIVLTNQPLKKVLTKPDALGRLVKWEIELGEYYIEFNLRPAVKSQVLADFLVEMSSQVMGKDFYEMEEDEGLPLLNLRTSNDDWKISVIKFLQGERLKDEARNQQMKIQSARFTLYEGKLMFNIHPRIAYNLADQDFNRVLTLHQDFKRNDLMKEGNRPYSITYRIAYALYHTHHSDLLLRKEYIEIPRIFKKFAKGLIDSDSFYEESKEEMKNLKEALQELKAIDISEESSAASQYYLSPEKYVARRELPTQVRELKHVCNNLPKLAIPQDEDELVVYTDANDYRWAAVLMKRTTTDFLTRDVASEANSIMLRLRHLRENLKELNKKFDEYKALDVAADSSTVCTRPSPDSSETATNESQRVQTSNVQVNPALLGNCRKWVASSVPFHQAAETKHGNITEFAENMLKKKRMPIWENKLPATEATRMKTCNMLYVVQWHNHVCPCCEKQEKPLFGTKIWVTKKKSETKPVAGSDDDNTGDGGILSPFNFQQFLGLAEKVGALEVLNQVECMVQTNNTNTTMSMMKVIHDPGLEMAPQNAQLVNGTMRFLLGIYAYNKALGRRIGSSMGSRIPHDGHSDMWLPRCNRGKLWFTPR
ncbi:UNVERIFIED_CONTAM: movement protein [Sesamum calycinum]|uniref:Movement protein n=1 Tax=Sesamum calycinum TaxID=2727403 RepID=A0AAW2NHT6_9LAMI